MIANFAKGFGFSLKQFSRHLQNFWRIYRRAQLFNYATWCMLGVFPADVWGNIVPPVTHKSGATFDGLNWDTDGQRIWTQDCVYVAPVIEQPVEPAPPAPASAPAPVAQSTPTVSPEAQVTPAEPPLPVVELGMDYPGFIPAAERPITAAVPEAATVPQAVSAAETATVPTAVNAGGGSSAPTGAPLWAWCLVIAGCASAALSAARIFPFGNSLR